MERLGNIFGIASLGVMAWQDFRTRRIAAWLLPVIAVSLLLAETERLSPGLVGRQFTINLCFLALQLFGLWVWISLRRKRFVNIVDSYIGLGDILFTVCIAPAFAPASFFLFYTFGAILVLLVALLVKMIRRPEEQLIPLAGALGLPLIALCLCRLIDPALDFFDDAWLSGWLDTVY